MASSMFSSAVYTTTTQANTVAPFIGFKSVATSFPVTRKSVDFASLPSNGGRVQCMKVWPTVGVKKFETLSYLPELTSDQLAKQVDYLLRSKLIPCLEFTLGEAFVHRENHSSPGYYDGRYWTMWKLPMFGCTDASQVLAEIEEAKKSHPDAHIRVIGFDNIRQVQSCLFIVYKPPSA